MQDFVVFSEFLTLAKWPLSRGCDWAGLNCAEITLCQPVKVIATASGGSPATPSGGVFFGRQGKFGV